MTNFKFKAWDEEFGCMYSGDEMESREEINTWLSYGQLAIYRISVAGDYAELKPLQYTGVQDRNGNEIYLGDIVTSDDDVEGTRKRVVCYDVHQAKYKAVPKSTYYVNAGNGGWTGFELRGYYEVIGNIYENPELLEA